MAKPTKYAPHLCTVFMIISFVGVVLGFIFSTPIIPIILLLPTAIYEAYRTEGKSTKIASYILVIVLIAQIVLVFFNISFNLAEFFGAEQQYIGGFWLPLGDLQLLGPMIIAVLSVILFTRTRGIYTRWLAGVIFISSLAIAYMLDPVTFQNLLRQAVQQAIRRF